MARTARDDVSLERRSSVISEIASWLGRNPYGLVAGAVGFGYVLGGGLFTRLTARFVGVGLRLGAVVVMPLLQERIWDGVSQAVRESKADGHSQRPPAVEVAPGVRKS